MASIWDKLKKSLGGTYDNLNIFDNGKTASKPASPVQMNPIAQLRDMIDANSPRDVYNRQQSGQPAIYRDQQIQMGNTRPHVNLGGQIFGSTARFINSGRAAEEMYLRELIEQPRFQIAKFTGNQGAQQAYFDRQRQFNEKTFDPNAGLFGEGTIFKNPSEVGNLSVAELTKRVGLNTAGTALEVIPMVKGASIAPKSGAAKVAIRIVGNAGASAGQDIIDQTQNRDNFSKEQLALSTLLGTVLPEGLGAVSRRLPKEIPSIKGDQRGALGFGDEGNQDKLGDILGNIEIGGWGPADIIAAEFGGKTVDIQRNIDRYGLQPTYEMYQRVGKAGTANNVDAVVTSELKKLYPEKLFNDDGVWKAYEQNPEAYAPQTRELPPEANTFVDVPQVDKTDYRGAHQIESNTSRNIGEINSIEDIAAQVKSKYGLTNNDHKNIGKLNKIIGNPDADVKVYRASPVGELNSGDWVTNDKIYANDIKRQNGGEVYEYTVKAKELNLPANIEDNPSLARFSAFQYSKSDIAPQARGLPPEANTFINAQDTQPTIKANEPSVDTPILDEPVKDAVEPTNAVNTQAEAPKAVELMQSLDKNVSVADATDNVAKILDAVSNEMDALDSELKANGSSLESVLREVQLADRENRELSPQAADILANRIKPILDSARQLSIDAGVKIGDIPNAYAPQMKAGRTRTVGVGGNLIDELSFTGVGSAERRLNQITLDELDYSKDSILDYVAQHLNQHYKEQNILKDIIFTEAEKGREVTEDAAKNILNVTKEVANKIQKTMDTAISIDDKAANAVGIADTEKFVKNILKLDILGVLNKIGDAKLILRKTIDDKLSLAESTVRSQFQIFNGIKVGDLTLSQALGQELYMNADAYANNALREHIETGFPAGDIIAGAFDMTTLSESTKKSLIENINRISSDDVTDVEALYKIASYIKGAAAKQATDFGENYNVTDPTLRKLINMQISRNITKDGYNRTLGSKLASAFTSAVHRGALYFNVKSSVANITELPRVAALLGSDFPDSLRKALQDVAQSKIPGREFDSITAKYGINERSAGDLLARERNKYRQTMRKRFVEQADRVGLQMFNTTEAVKDATVLYGLEAKYAREGYVGVDLTRKVMKEFNTYSIKGGFDNAIGLQRSSAGRALFQFVTYPIRNTDIMLTQTKKALLEKDRKALGFLAIYTGGVAATYATIGAVLGMPIEYILGVFNPAEDNMNRDSGATDEVISRLPGGPLVDAMKDIYFGAKDEMSIAKEEGREFDVSNLWNSATKKDASLLIPGSVQFNKVMGGKKLLETGYDASAKGLARYAAPTDNYNKAMALIFGKSSTSNAREYFGTQGIGGDLPNMGGEKQLPVSKQWQELIDRAGNNPAVIEDIINRARTARKDQTDFFRENPTLKAVYEQATFIQYDPKTGKGVSDVITPDKWKSIQSDTTLSLYEFMREKAMLNNREFGVPVDPIYKLQDDNKIREVMQLRALPTGDDTEIKDILQGKDWYKQFEKDYAEYIKTQLASGTTDIENSPRKAEYLKIQSENPAQAPKSDVMQQYEFYRNAGDEDSRKAFYADNAEKLSAEYSKRSEDYRVWTNKMRAIEGVDPISKEVWDNSTRGFNYDELKTAKSIAAKNNAYLKEFTPYSSGGSSRSTGRSSGAGSNRVARVDYGNVKSLQTAKLVKPKKVKIVNKKAKNGTIKVSKGKIKI